MDIFDERGTGDIQWSGGELVGSRVDGSHQVRGWMAHPGDSLVFAYPSINCTTVYWSAGEEGVHQIEEFLRGFPEGHVPRMRQQLDL